jgi:hypothetical protein
MRATWAEARRRATGAEWVAAHRWAQGQAPQPVATKPRFSRLPLFIAGFDGAGGPVRVGFESFRASNHPRRLRSGPSLSKEGSFESLPQVRPSRVGPGIGKSSPPDLGGAER